MASTLAAFVASAGMCAVSRLNYPGGEALQRLHKLVANSGEKGVKRVHMDTLTCMTGATRFLQQPLPSPLPASGLEKEGKVFWIYDKTEENLKLLDPSSWHNVDYALAERLEKAIGDWEILDTMDGFAGFLPVFPGMDMCQYKESKDLVSIRPTLYGKFECFVRQHVSRGWWVKVRMEPKIRILKRIESVKQEPEVAFVEEAAGDDEDDEDEDDVEDKIP